MVIQYPEQYGRLLWQLLMIENNINTSDLKEIYIVGRPRSGTVWLNRLVADALDSPLEAPGPNANKAVYFGPGRDGGYVVRKTHDGKKYGPTVFIQRDPRDVAVSTMFYRQTADLFAVVRQMCEPYSASYEYYIRMWLDDKNRAEYYTTYELLQTYTSLELYLIIQDLTGKHFEDEYLATVVKRQSFDTIKAADTTDRYKHSMRKGIVGDWKNHFTREVGKYMHEHLGKFLLEQRYITDDSWWKELE